MRARYRRRYRHTKKGSARNISAFFFMAVIGLAVFYLFHVSGAEDLAENAVKDAFSDPETAKAVIAMEMSMADSLKDALTAESETEPPATTEQTKNRGIPLDIYENPQAPPQKSEPPEITPPSTAPKEIYTISESLMPLSDLLFMQRLKPLQRITIAPQDTGGYELLSGVLIKNDTEIDLSKTALSAQALDFAPEEDAPQVLIVHTHGSEAYTDEGNQLYTPEDGDRTLDKNYNVIRVGDELKTLLTRRGIGVLHNREIFDSPSYGGSYDRSLAAIEKAIAENPSIRMVIDIHRDAMITKEGVKYKTVTDINGESAAQLMFVVGTDAGGLSHPDWAQNLGAAVELQKELNTKYPDLCRPVNLRTSRFNQHMTPASMLLEVGTCGNTLTEALLGITLFANVLGDMLVGT